jgi:hemoglobin
VGDVRILLISGSTRRGSGNTAALRTVQATAPDGITAEMYEGLTALPAFSPDEDEQPPGPAAELRARIAAADALLFCTPEYAGTLPGSLKNLLDWTVGGGEIYGKPVGWINVAVGGRGTGAEEHLAMVLRYVGAVAVEEACVRVPVPRDAAGPDGTIADPSVRAALGAALTALAEHARGRQTVYEAAGGDGGLLRLAHAWHARVMADEVVSHAFSHGYHPQHTERLAAYWAEALGGPATYTDRYGDETSVVRLHSGNGQHEDMDTRAVACFDRALADAGLTADDRLRQVLHDYFAWATTTAMARYPQSADDVPDGLRIPHWSWDGLVSGSGPGS